MRDKGKKELLERLQAAAGCSYLSDLSVIARSRRKSIIREMKSMGGGQYSLSEWNDAVSYITGYTHGFQSVQDAVDFLIQYLK